GTRLNSPNDLVYRSDGTLYFTDPPFGLPKVYEDPGKELPYSGVFSVSNGALKLVGTDLAGPNGLAFSPDEKFLYVDNWDEKRKVVMRYDVRPDGSLANGIVFFDMTGAPGAEALDGLKVDHRGDLYASGLDGQFRSRDVDRERRAKPLDLLGAVAGPDEEVVRQLRQALPQRRRVERARARVRELAQPERGMEPPDTRTGACRAASRARGARP